MPSGHRPREGGPLNLRAAVFLTVLAAIGCRPKGGAPTVPPAAAPDARGMLVGRVAERIDAPPYSYLRLSIGKAEAWAAVPQTPTPVGAEVTVVGAAPMANFESKTLHRRFPVVYFGTLQAPAGVVEQRGVQHALAAQGPSDVVVPRLPKAAGPEARTVAEVHAQRASLQDHPVVLQGQVVKVNMGIMGRNWLHVRDGSGEGATADLTITTQEKTDVGEVVILRGTVRLDRDFGAGYRYPVIVEDAKLRRPKGR
ncbi:MAG TPA: hypothetical protein VJ623_01480 [Holophagaceae bacterium]|nr:hypothetical protein [Holophagaceae bacterium]